MHFSIVLIFDFKYVFLFRWKINKPTYLEGDIFIKFKIT